MAAAILAWTGLFVAFVAASAGGGWPWPAALAVGAGVTALAAVALHRLGLAGGQALLASTGRAAALALAEGPGRAADGAQVLAAALGLRERAPVFVRLKLRPAAPHATASVIAAMSATPGTVVVDADAASLLAHLLVEADVDVPALQKLERAVIAGGGAQP